MESIKFTTHQGNIMNKYRTEILDLLLAESEAMDTADGKGVADASVKSSAAPSGGEKETKVKLTGGGDEVGGSLPAKPPVGKVPGGEPTMDDMGGKGLAKEGGKSETSSGGKGEKMKPEGDSIADTTVNQTKDLPKNPNLAKEGKFFVIPHDIMVEHDGKVTKLAAGTKISLVAESAEKCEDEKCADEKCAVHGKVKQESKDKKKGDHKKPAESATEKGLAKADKGNKKAHMKESLVKEEEEGEDKPFGGESEDKPEDGAEESGESEGSDSEGASEEAAPEGDSEPTPPTPPSAEEAAVESDIPEMSEDTPIADAGTDSNIIDRLAMSIDHFAQDFKEFLGVEKEEPEHQDEGGEEALLGDEEEAPMDFGAISDLPADVGTDETLVTDSDLPEVGQNPNPFAR